MDLGSNTLRLLVAEVEGQDFKALARALATPRLGRGLKQGGGLASEAQEAALRQADVFARQARSLGAARVVLAATQACRRAVDGAEFVARLGRELNLDRAVVLSGEEEASLSRRGVLSRLAGPVLGAILADVGGGSIEIKELGPNPGPGLSLALGAVSLTEAFLRHDPPRSQELRAMDQAVEQGLALLDGRKTARLVATAGTAAALANLRMGLNGYKPERIDNFQVRQGELEEEYARLAELDLAKRRKVRGLEPERADIILAGLAVLKGLLRKLNLGELTVMDAGLLEGILLADSEGLI